MSAPAMTGRAIGDDRRSNGAMAFFDAIARRPRLAALAGALCLAFSGIFFRFSGVSPETGTVFRCLYALPWLAPLVVLERRQFGTPSRRQVIVGIVAGVFFAADLVTWQHGIEAVGAGLATVLGNLQVVVVAAVAWALFGERPSRPTFAALPIMVVGVILISGVVGSGAYGTNPPLGVALGFMTAFAYAGYLVVARQGMQVGGGPATPLFISTTTTAMVGGAVGLVLGSFDAMPSWPAHGWLALVGLTSQAAGYLFISLSLPRLPAVITSLILLAQPVMTVLFAAVLLGESPSAFQLAGVALLIGGLAVANVGRRGSREQERAVVRRATGAGGTPSSVTGGSG